MIKNILRFSSLLCLSLLGTSALSFAQPTALVGITETDQVFTITNAATPGTITTPVAITGLTAGMTVAGADYRPNTGELFLLGYNSATTAAQLYTLNAATGVATAVGSAITLPLGTGSIGFDFNPTVDRIRVVAANRANYRLNPITGGIAATDGQLTYATGDVNAALQPSVGAAAYTNSYIGAEATALYDYDENLNVLALQNPPNNGTLNTVGNTGILINTVNRTVDMDIYTNPFSGANTAYLIANTGVSTNDNLYTLSTSTGTATLIGTIGSGIAVKDIAAVITRNVPQNVTGRLIYGLTRVNRNLLQFDSDAPGTIRNLRGITGMNGGQRIAAIDVRPKTLQLYGLGYNDTTQTFGLYTIDPATGAATQVGSTDTLRLGRSNIGFDFNPTVDRIRVVGTNDSNYRLNPDLGTIAARDAALVYAAGDAGTGKDPNIGSVAYTNSYAGATTTTLYGIDDTLGSFVTIASPNNGVLTTTASGIFVPNNTDLSSDIDVFYDSVNASNTIYLVANSAGSNNDAFYTVFPNGQATMISPIGTGTQLIDIAVQLRYTGPKPTGIGNIHGADFAAVYPNPAGAALNVVIKGNRSVSARLLDATGRVVISAVGTSRIVLNTSSLSNGLYLLSLQAEDGSVQAIRVVKQ